MKYVTAIGIAVSFFSLGASIGNPYVQGICGIGQLLITLAWLSQVETHE